MDIKQVASLLNGCTKEILGDNGLAKEDLSNVVDIGSALIDASAVDKFTGKLLDQIGKIVFVNRSYEGSVPSILKDSWQYGAILEKIAYDGLPDATENKSWDLKDGTSYDTNVFTQPKVTSKFFSKKITFEIPMSFATKQVESAFQSGTQLNAFFSMIENAIANSMTVKLDSLGSRTINNMIAQTYNGDSKGLRAVNLLANYKASGRGSALTAKNCIYDKEFIRYVSFIISLYQGRLTKISGLFNGGDAKRFTPKSKQHLVLLSEFYESANTYLESDTFHNEFVKLPKCEQVPYWQGSSTDYSFEKTSMITTTIQDSDTTKDVSLSGILGVLFDDNALGITNMDRRVTSSYNARGEFCNNWFKYDAGYFNDLNENFVVFYVADGKAISDK